MPKNERLASVLLGAAASFGVLLQLFLVLAPGNAVSGFFGTLIRYFSYFTVLTNLLAALVITIPLVSGSPRLVAFCRDSDLRTAVATYITVVAVVHAALLRGLVDLDGASLLADTFLHVITPIAYVVFWFLLTPKQGLAWGASLRWLWFPASYLAYVFLRGALGGVYPYPFIDVGRLGAVRAFWNAAAVGAAFLLAGLIFIAIDRAVARSMRGEV